MDPGDHGAQRKPGNDLPILEGGGKGLQGGELWLKRNDQGVGVCSFGCGLFASWISGPRDCSSLFRRNDGGEDQIN